MSVKRKLVEEQLSEIEFKTSGTYTFRGGFVVQTSATDATDVINHHSDGDLEMILTDGGVMTTLASGAMLLAASLAF